MKSSYDKIPLGKLSKIFSGFAFKSADLIENPDEAYPVIKIANIQNKKVLKFGSGHLPKNQFVEKLSKYKLDKDDFLVAMTGAGSVGKVGKMRNPDQTYLVNQRVGVVRSDKSKVDPEYLFQVLSHDYYEEYLYQLGVGSGQPNVSATDIGNLKVPYPDIETQRNIASTLSAFDDLIENNTRRIEILEEMARIIYHEWFVHYRYPGHKNDKLVDSGTDLGEIPEGWEVKEVDQIVNRLSKGQIYRKNNVSDNGKVIVIDQSTDQYLGFHNKDPDFNASFEKPYIIFGDHTCKLQLMTKPFSLGPNVVPFIPENKEQSTYYMYWLVEGLIESREYKRHWSSFKVKKVAVAPIDLSKAFEEKVNPIYKQLEVLKSKNRKLKETRELLLPKLISGTIKVN